MSSPRAHATELALLRQIRWGVRRAHLRLGGIDPGVLRPKAKPVARRAALIGLLAQSPLLLFPLLSSLPRVQHAQQAPGPEPELIAQPELIGQPELIAQPELIVQPELIAQPGAPRAAEPQPAEPIVAVQPESTAESGSCAPGSLCSPVPMAFPFSHRGSTRTSTEQLRSSYSCAPEILQGGPEIWFSFQLAETSHWSAAIEEAALDGVDIDLNLLAEDGSTCLHRGDARIETTLLPGTYLLVLDTCTNPSTGKDQPGPFHLTAQATPLHAGSPPAPPVP